MSFIEISVYIFFKFNKFRSSFQTLFLTNFPQKSLCFHNLIVKNILYIYAIMCFKKEDLFCLFNWLSLKFHLWAASSNGSSTWQYPTKNCLCGPIKSYLRSGYDGRSTLVRYKRLSLSSLRKSMCTSLGSIWNDLHQFDLERPDTFKQVHMNSLKVLRG